MFNSFWVIVFYNPSILCRWSCIFSRICVYLKVKVKILFYTDNKNIVVSKPLQNGTCNECKLTSIGKCPSPPKLKKKQTYYFQNIFLVHKLLSALPSGMYPFTNGAIPAVLQLAYGGCGLSPCRWTRFISSPLSKDQKWGQLSVLSYEYRG
jgi:hypothetical protein